MKTSGFCVCAVFAGCVLIVGCAQPTELSRVQFTPSVDSLRNVGANRLTYLVLHSFGADHDGDYPNSGLLCLGDAFYGATYGGGSGTRHCGSYGGCGTVFSMSASGAEKVLHSFGGTKTGGRLPYAPLIDVNGTLYGTTGYGGRFEYGTVFSITLAGNERVLHNFGEGTDGNYPTAALLDVGGTFYGTTSNGGANQCGGSDNGCGTVFSITSNDKEKLYGITALGVAGIAAAQHSADREHHSRRSALRAENAPTRPRLARARPKGASF